MAKSKSRIHRRRPAMPSSKRSRMLAIGVLVSLTLTGAAFAAWGGLFATQKQRTSSKTPTPPSSPTPQSFDPASPSKEYVYAGGRLIATEEPAGAPPQCAYSLSAGSRTYTPAGTTQTGPDSFGVIATAGCAWTAGVTAGGSFITITSGASGSGNGSVFFTVAQNTTAGTRTGAITVSGGQTPLAFNITQTGSTSCTVTISPPSQNFTSQGGSGTVSVTAGAGCPWTATNNNPDFITITSGGSGSGPGSVQYTVAGSQLSQQRTGTLLIGDKTFTVIQSGVPAPPNCTYGISPTNISIPGSSASGNITLTTTQSTCSWSITNSTNWIHPSPTSGNGTTNISYTVDANTTGSPRIGTIKIAGLAFTVNQAAGSGGGGGGGGNGLRAEYYNFCGTCSPPAKPECGNLVLTRADATVDFDWGWAAQVPASLRTSLWPAGPARLRRRLPSSIPLPCARTTGCGSGSTINCWSTNGTTSTAITGATRFS